MASQAARFSNHASHHRNPTDNAQPRPPNRPIASEEDESGPDEDGSRDTEKDKPPHHRKPVGFFHSQLDEVRMKVFLHWAQYTAILCLFILGMLSLYWALLYRVEPLLPSLVVYVVDFESSVNPNALLGPIVRQATEKIVREDSMPHLGYVTMDPAQFSFDPLQVREAVYEKQAWAAVIVHANATSLLQTAVASSGNASYDPLGAGQIIYVQARDQDTIGNYITPHLTSLTQEIGTQFASKWIPQVMSNTSLQRTTLAQVPQALDPAVGFTMMNLRPFTPPTATPAVSIGLIYLIIISFFSFAFFTPVHLTFMQPKGHPPLKRPHLILWRWCATMVFYLLASLFYSLVSLAFQIPFWPDPVPGTTPANNATAFARGTFPVYWMINFWGMSALGLASENVAMVIGQPWSSLWLVFWVITNVSTSFYALDLAPGFFHWGYAWPLYHVVNASREVLFDLHLELGTHFGVLIAWAVVGTILFPFASWFMGWKTRRAQAKSD